MPVEAVTTIADLNPLWPLGSDQKQYGDDHLRNIKVALKSLVGGTGGPGQMGFTTIEQPVLTAPVTNITYGGVIQQGSQVVVFLQQDGTGGRQVTWDGTKFEFAPVDINIEPNGLTICSFVGRSNGKLACHSVRML